MTVPVLRNSIRAGVLTTLLLMGACGPTPEENGREAVAASSSVTAEHDALTDHLVRAFNWSDSVYVEVPQTDVSGPSDGLEHMVTQALGELGAAQNAVDTLVEQAFADEADEPALSRIETVRDGVESAIALATGIDDYLKQPASEGVLAEVRDQTLQLMDTIARTGDAHDSLVATVGESTPVRLFSRSRPHHEVARRLALAQKTVLEMRSQEDSPGRRQAWQAGVNRIDADLNAATAAFTAVTTRANPTLGQRFSTPERLDDAVNRCVDEIQVEESAARDVLRDLREALWKEHTDAAPVVELLDALDQRIGAAVTRHREMMELEGYPAYPEYDSGI